jgi:hypothetical protein
MEANDVSVLHLGDRLGGQEGYGALGKALACCVMAMGCF